MHIDSLDHLVLTVRDVEATCAFYRRVLGMGVVTFGEGRKALAFGAQGPILSVYFRDPDLNLIEVSNRLPD